ncbi:MAG: PAS domain S-box protein [Deltaproteobacteria bacterium]|nr:PAS domain S-box protein [Deltaproteobacteria bacterium]
MKFKTKIILSYLVLFGLSAGMLLTVFFSYGIKGEERYLLGWFESETAHVLNSLDRFFFERISDLSLLSTDAVITSAYADRESITKRLTEYRDKYKVYESLTLYDAHRMVLADTSNLDIGRPAGLPVSFQRALAGTSQLIDFTFSEVQGRVMLTIFEPVRDERGQPGQVLAARIPIERVYDLVREFHLGLIPVKVRLELISTEGRILYSSFDKKSIYSMAQDVETIQSVVAELKEGRSSIRVLDKPDRITVVAANKGYRGYGGNIPVIRAVAFKDSLLGEIKRRTMVMLLMFAVMLLLSIWLIWQLARGLGRPLDDLAKRAKALGRGDFAAMDGLPVRDDEFGVLTDNFKMMADDLRRSLAEVNLKSLNLEQEVEERRRVEVSLEGERRRFFAILNNLPGFVCLVGPDYSIRFSNLYFKNLLGGPEKKTCHELFYNQSQPCRTCVAAGVLQNLKPETWEWAGPDGLIFQVYAYPFMDIDGSPLILKLGMDITERKKAEEALRQREEELRFSEEKYRTLFDAESDSIFLTEQGTGQIIDANRTISQMYGYSPEELIGRPNTVISAQPDKTVEYNQNPVNHVPLRYHLKKDGVVFPVEITANTLTLGGRKVVIAAVRDITDRLRAEQLIAASLKEKEVLLKEIHHRVKNNLLVIAGLLDMQCEYSPDPQIRNILGETKGRVRSMALIHERLYSSPNLAYVDFKEYISSLTNTLFKSYGIRPGKITLKTEIADISIGIDTATPCGLVLNELISNCLKHAFPDDRQGEIRVTLCSRGQSGMDLIVGDNGVGMPQELNLRNISTLGWELITGLVSHQLGGEVEVKRDGGTEVIIKINRIR